MVLCIDLEPQMNDLKIDLPFDQLKSHLLDVFKSHRDYTSTLLKIAQHHLETCIQLFQQHTVQLEALGIASLNLKLHGQPLFEQFDAYYELSQKEFTRHDLILFNFPIDLETLNQIPIHPTFAQEKKMLGDFVPHVKIMAWYERCKMAHGHAINLDHLVAKTEEFRTVIESIRSQTLSEPTDIE